MKKVIYIVLSVLLGILGFVLYRNFVTPKSPKDTVTFNDKGVEIKIVYSRPYKRERLIFGEEKDQPLLPFGKYWRLGANDATEISLSKNVTFAGKSLQAGTYRMYAVPGSDSFEISLNRELGVSSAHNEPDYTQDVLKINVPVEEVPETEQLTIIFNPESSVINMDIVWDRARLRVPIIPD